MVEEIRFFSFGCSFTRYVWPTWADILAHSNFKNFQNWGQIGAGNHYIFNSVIECHLRNQLNKNDIVAIMWSNVSREDRYINNRWITPGNIYSQEVYDSAVVKQIADMRGFYIRDLALIYATKSLLDSLNCKYFFFSMVPITNDLQYDTHDITEEIVDLLDYYKETLKIIRSSVYEIIFNFDWWSRPINADFNNLKKHYYNCAGKDWPSFENFLSKNFQGLNQTVINELTDEDRWNWTSKIRNHTRKDTHPTPVEHLEYLDKVLPEFEISQSTKNWCLEIDSLIWQNKSFDKMWNPVKISRW